jgi:alkylation response protein AidB-like acyl-CoA dehydrogenase
LRHSLYQAGHEDFRDGVRAFLEKAVAPFHDAWVLSGAKTFVTNGINADLVVVVARTATDVPAARGTSLLVVERGMPGFARGRNLAKVGLEAQDTAELSFDDVRVPAENLLGTEHGGFGHLMDNLPQERLSIAAGAVAAAETVLDLTLDHVTTRTAFGRPVGSFQPTASSSPSCARR